MSVVKTEVIVLRTRHFSESSLIATLFGRRGGRLDVLAKGCRREKSLLFGHLDVYRREEAIILERPQAGLDLLLDAACLDEHTGLRFSPPSFAAAGLLADLAAEAVQPGDSQPELFDALAQSLRILSAFGEGSARAGLSPALPFSMGEKK
ncbi:MAG: recombination protein O N-terminal domain-containing protein, partial [Planctomycetota bacterium]|nr:recombination protein O N-terminal domain-containing protein [Planctomycetota bacterium]